jgi:hypothetical protein
MDEILRRLFEVLQELKAAAPGVSLPASCWYVERRGGPPEGPWHPAELAFLARTRRLRLDDTVSHTAHGARLRAVSHPALARWFWSDGGDDRRLLRELSACARAWTEAAAAAAAAPRPAAMGAAPSAAATRATAAASAAPATSPPPAARPLTTEQRRAFGLLQLDPGCTRREARARLRALAAEHHPDRGGSVERMQEITWAWRVVRKAVGG